MTPSAVPFGYATAARSEPGAPATGGAADGRNVLGGQKHPVDGGDWTAPRLRLGFRFSPRRKCHGPGNYGVVVVPLPPKRSDRIHWKSNGRNELKSELNRPVNMGCFSGKIGRAHV